MTLTIGIDVGGTKTACVVTDVSDRILFHDVVPTDKLALTAQIVALAQRAIGRVADDQVAGGPNSGPVAAIGVAIPGQVEPRRGTAELAVNLGAPGINLGSAVEAGTGLPCFVEHDARAAAAWVYERRDGGELNGADLCYLSVGTGIAAGIVLGGRTLSGETGLAGEVGHVVVDPAGSRCPCGSTGCLETVAAGPAIARQARQAVAAGRSTTLTSEATAADVFEAANEGDELANEITTRLGEHLARTVRGLVLTLGIQRIVIGGGVAGGGDALLTPIKQALHRERLNSPLVETAFADASLELLPPDLEPGARGAAAIARQRMSAQQREEVAER
jgi:predicted NBD/HSP70 family sugar kinase